MAKSEHFTTHPFPYFGTPVTRDVNVIKQCISEKYKKVAHHEKHHSTQSIFKEFLFNAGLIAEKIGGVGEYCPKPASIQEIIDKIYPSVEADIKNYAVPDNKIHPAQQQLILANAVKNWYLAADVAQWMFDKAVKANNIQIAADKVKTAVPKQEPVTNQKAVCLASGVKLTWTLPAGCRETEISRESGDPSAPKFTPIRLKQSECEYFDSAATPGFSYNYRIGTVIADLPPGAFVTLLNVCPFGAVRDLKVVAQGTSAAKLTWKNPEAVTSILVLRSQQPIPAVVSSSGQLQPLPAGVDRKSLPSCQEHVDSTVHRGATYFFQVVAEHPTSVCSVSAVKSISLHELPPAPQSVVAEAHYGSISVKWPQVQTPGDIYYVVTRAEAPDPHDPAANAVTWKTKGHLIQDPSPSNRGGKSSRPDPEPGCSYWYSVATEIDGRRSDPPTLSNRVLAKAEVSGFKGLAENERVVLTWKMPKRAKRVEIRRSQSSAPAPPAAPGKASPTETLFRVESDQRFTDEKLHNDQSYFYRISCVYIEQDGSEVITIGDVIELKPVAPPGQIDGLKIHRPKTGSGICVSWNPPEPENRGCVVRAAELPGQSIGHVCRVDDLDRLGEVLSSNGATSAIDYHPHADQPYYLIFSASNQAARYCGHCQFLEVGALSAKVNGRSAALDWQWPAECREAVVTAYRQDGLEHWVELHTRSVPRRGQEVMGHLAIAMEQDGRYRVRVACTADGRGRQLAGPGVCREVDVGHMPLVSWKLEKPAAMTRWISRKPVVLAVQADSELRSVSSLLLVGKEADMPNSPSDGVCLAEVAVSDPSARQWRLPIRTVQEAFGTRSVGEVWCRLFSSPEGAAVISPPPFDQRKLDG